MNRIWSAGVGVRREKADLCEDAAALSRIEVDELVVVSEISRKSIKVGKRLVGEGLRRRQQVGERA